MQPCTAGTSVCCPNAHWAPGLTRGVAFATTSPLPSPSPPEVTRIGVYGGCEDAGGAVQRRTRAFPNLVSGLKVLIWSKHPGGDWPSSCFPDMLHNLIWSLWLWEKQSLERAWKSTLQCGAGISACVCYSWALLCPWSHSLGDFDGKKECPFKMI